MYDFLAMSCIASGSYLNEILSSSDFSQSKMLKPFTEVKDIVSALLPIILFTFPCIYAFEKANKYQVISFKAIQAKLKKMKKTEEPTEVDKVAPLAIAGIYLAIAILANR